MFKKELYPNCYKGYQYAKDILDGKINANVYVIGSCQRFMDDLERAKDDKCFFYFDPAKAERFLRLVQRFKHVKGVWKNPYLVYEPWQCFMGMNIYGFINKNTGSRRFRKAHVEVARGNGKSAIGSQFGLYHLSLENPKGNEVYSAATGRDQARIVLDSARAMAKANKSFLRGTGTEVLAHKIIHRNSNSEFKALSSDSNTLDGLQPACAIIDELHAHRDRSVFDVIASAMSKRRDSLMFTITTAGFKTTGIGYSQSQYAKKVSTGEVEDDYQFVLVYTLDENDDPFDPDVWIKANPNFGVSVDPENFAAEAHKAKNNPQDINNFLVKHLNMWVNAMTPFFSVSKWGFGFSKGLRIEDFKGEKCYVGIDLSSKVDITSFGYIFKPDEKYRLFSQNFIPEQAVKESSNTFYDKWVHDNWLTLTPGEAISYLQLQEKFMENAKDYSIQEAFFDPWNSMEFAQRMELEGIEMTEFKQNVGNFSEPMKMFEAEIRKGNMIHPGNPIVQWALGNVVAKYDAKDNVFPRKDAPELKIDPVIALLMPFAGWLKVEDENSVYESNDLLIL